MSLENPLAQNGEKPEILELLQQKFPELNSYTLENLSLPVPGSGLRIVEMEGESDTRYFKVDLDTAEATEWKPAEREG